MFRAGWGGIRLVTSAAIGLSIVLGLAGCVTPPQADAPDWHEHEVTLSAAPAPVVVPSEPKIAAPPTNPPLPVTAATPHSNEIWVPLQRWVKGNSLFSLTRQSPALQPTYVLHSASGTFVMHAGSQIAQWNGLELRLGFAPQMIDGQPYVHTLDLHKTIEPLLGGMQDIWLGMNPVIVIDPGHGGSDAGTKSILNGHYEKEFTLDWALRLEALLATNGWRVFLTRSTDCELALSNRVAFAELHKASLFLSLHFNSAAPNQSESGLETYCLTPAGMPSSLTRGFADDTAQNYPNNAFDAQNLQLALRVHRALLQATGTHDRGVRRARFPAVLRWQQRPAILIEGGYLSNPHEAALIASPAYRQKAAEGVAAALAAVRPLNLQPGPGAITQMGPGLPYSMSSNAPSAVAVRAAPPKLHAPATSRTPASTATDSEEVSHNPEIQ